MVTPPQEVRIAVPALEAMRQHGREGWPEESCGLLLGDRNGGTAVVIEAARCPNRQNEYHARFPEDYPRDATTAYLLDFRDFERVETEARERGLTVLGIYHTHCECGAYFSDEDRAVATAGGDEAMFPDFCQIVQSIVGREAREARGFSWDSSRRSFVEIPLRTDA